MESAHFPALRHVDVVPVEHEGQQLLCISDPLGYVEEQLVLSPAAFFVAASLDGVSGVAQVQDAFASQFGARVAEEQVREVAQSLDAAGFLLSPRFDEIRAEVEGAFRDASTRPASLAGKSYPADPDELRAFLGELFAVEGGEAPEAADDAASPLRCLVVPHIDFARGGSVYAKGYRALLASGKPDTVIIFGVAHCGVPSPFTLTRKRFETPLGTLETDQDLVDALADACDYDPFEHEFVHRGEHSIEFQAVMLAYLYGPNVKICPILCSSFASEGECSDPAEVAAVDRFLKASRALVDSDAKCVTVIAAADLAHVGRRFGDDFEIDDSVVDEVAQRDEQDLAHVLENAPGAFYASVMQDQNARRVCGLGCIYAALRTANGTTARGTLHGYDYAHDPAGGIVSFASIGFAPDARP